MKKKIFAVALAATMALASAVSAFANITGDLTVTGFFNEKTSTVELKSGDSYTFKFNNKSNGTNNWDNYVLVIGGVSDNSDWPGPSQEALIFRADNWGWGGELSDFVAPNVEDGNTLVFETNVEDWAAFAAAAKEGVACEVTVSRTGNKLDYSAKVGEFTFATSATSGKDLPESLYVFFTGENVALTGFQTINNNAAGDDTTDETTVAAPAEKPSPKTADATTTLAIVIAMMGAAAVVVTFKKRSISE